MRDTTRQQQEPAKARRRVISSVVSAVLGWTLAFFGGVLTLSVLAVVLVGDPAALILLPYCATTLGGGVYILKTRKIVRAYQEAQQEEAERQGSPQAYVPQPPAPVRMPQESPDAAPHSDPQGPASNWAPQGETASQAPLSEETIWVPAPEPTHPEPDGQELAAQESEASPAQPASIEEVARLVFRSNDFFATLRDLVQHATADGDDKLHLVSMLQAAGVMSWPDAPACEGNRLARNGRFWIRQEVDDLTDEQYDILVAAEAALGFNQDLPQLCTLSLDDPHVENAAVHFLRSTVNLPMEPSQLTELGLNAAYGSKGADYSSGEWPIRSRISNAAESASLPFRVVYDLRANAQDGLVVLSLETPRPRCMAIFSSHPQDQVQLARAYAFRLCVLLGSYALEASPQVRRVVANCHEHGGSAVLLSMDIDRDSIDELRCMASGPQVEQGLPQGEHVRADLSLGWLGAVEPFVALDDPAATPEQARIYPELDERPAPLPVLLACGARRICDLGINENAVRIRAWNELYPQLGGSTEQAVSTLVAARNAAADITVAEACNRTLQALVAGEVDLDDTNELASLFVSGSALDQAVERAVTLLDDSDGPANPQEAISILEGALAPIEDMGVYLDDEHSVYRYFGSVSERINHNLYVDEGGREVHLVPDAYFNAHSNACIALDMLGENERALAHADVCLRLAPTSTAAAMRKVRSLEMASRIFEAVNLIKETLRHASTPHDAALCHYRLAYMEWRLGREDLAAACYRRCLTWNTQFSSQAREELDDLLSTNESLRQQSHEQVDALLGHEGIPLGCTDADGERTLAAAVACMDADAFITATTLMAVLFAMNSDDVVMGVYRSLSVSV